MKITNFFLNKSIHSKIKSIHLRFNETKIRVRYGETDQMGGNFIVDANGIVRFAYASKDPTDRPSIESMMTVLHTLN